MKIKYRFLGFVVWATMILLSIGCFSAASFLTGFFMKHTGYHRPFPDLLLQIINLLIATFIFYILSWYGLKKFNPVQYAKHRNFGVFGLVGLIVKAMEQIGRGDFNVRLETGFNKNDTIDELVQGMNQMALELSRMEKMRQEFIANVSHEIQSPLTSIRGFARTLRNENLTAADKLHYLEIIETESMRLSKLSDNLLKLASLEAATIRFQPQSYRLDKQVRDIILACEPQWAAKKIEMEVSIAAVTITADEDLLSQVWNNLIHNSIKFTAEGGKVLVDLHLQDHQIEFKISDTGIGMAAEDQNHIFERFYKADQSRRSANKGSGLGLAIARKIVEMHRGTIAVQSKLGAGSTFTVTLPVE